jgi:dipeptidyl aminopeptidase/acylaminoacyl peptidase
MKVFRNILGATLLAATVTGMVAAVPAAAAPAAVAEAATPRQPVVALDLYRLEQPVDPQLSPDGRQVAVLRQTRDLQTDQVKHELWLVDVASGARRLLVGAERSPGGARWAPDGTRLAFVGREGGKPQVFVLDLADGRARPVTESPQPPRSISWSRDSRSLAYVALVETVTEPFYKLPEKPAGAQWAPAARLIRDYPYRTDGDGWSTPGQMHVFVVSTTGGPSRQLTRGAGDWGMRDESPAWLPDGSAIIVSADTDPAARRRAGQSDLWLWPLAEGAAPQQLTRDDGSEQSPAVSPDGSRLAYVGWRIRRNSYQRNDLFVMPLVRGETPANPASTVARNLTLALDRNTEQPRWREDGASVFFLYQDRGVNRVGEVDAAGGTPPRPRVPEVGNTRLLLPSSSGGSYSVAAGSFAYPSVEPDRPPALALHVGNAEQILWDLNAAWREGKAIGALEEIIFPSSADRRPVQGWILYPPDFDPAKKYPLALDIHGGPHLDYGPMFSVTHHLYAAAGYVVLFINPRGSIGYGEAFASLINRAYPGKDHDDLMSAVDAVVARGFIDPQRLYIGGGSGGGVLSSWAIGKTDRFAAASVKRPVINWASTALTTDIGTTMGQFWFDRMPWEEPEKYWARSPLSLVGKVRTPTLIITGEQDFRTPMSDSEQYFQALQLRGVESALMRLPEASHSFGRPSQWLAAILGTIGWYDRHVNSGASATAARAGDSRE